MTAYRLFTFVSGVCLLAAGLLAIAARFYPMGSAWCFGGNPGDRGSVLIFNRVISIGYGGGHYLLSVAFSELAILLALPALVWGFVTLRRLRRVRKRPAGFPVEPTGTPPSDPSGPAALV
jgi:hypothetical protein